MIKYLTISSIQSLFFLLSNVGVRHDIDKTFIHIQLFIMTLLLIFLFQT